MHQISAHCLEDEATVAKLDADAKELQQVRIEQPQQMGIDALMLLFGGATTTTGGTTTPACVAAWVPRALGETGWGCLARPRWPPLSPVSSPSLPLPKWQIGCSSSTPSMPRHFRYCSPSGPEGHVQVILRPLHRHVS